MSEKEKGWSSGVLTAIIALPILYVLSIGPAIYTLGATGAHFSSPLYTTLTAFYKPVALLYEHTPLKTPLGWYCELWEYEQVYHSTVPIHTSP